MNVNPVLSRELKQRFRRGKSPLFFTLWLAIVAAFAYLIFLAGRSFARSFGGFGIGSFASSAALGRMMFELTALFIMTAVLFVVPGLMALSVVGERERLTLRLLQMSQMRPREIIMGKLTSGLSYVLLLLVAVGPVLVLPVIIGGVSLTDALAALAITVLTAITLGSISVWVSARAKTSRGAVAGSYLWAFVLAVGTMILLVAEVLLIQPSGGPGGGEDGREFYSLWPNPYVALVSAVSEPVESGGGVLFGTPFRSGAGLLAERQGGSFSPFQREFNEFGSVFEIDVNQTDATIVGAVQGAGNGPDQALKRGPVWIRSVAIYVVIIALTITFAARAVASPEPPPLLRRRARAPTGDSVAAA